MQDVCVYVDNIIGPLLYAELLNILGKLGNSRNACTATTPTLSRQLMYSVNAVSLSFHLYIVQFCKINTSVNIVQECSQGQSKT